MKIKPYKNLVLDKKYQIKKMFNNISKKYDLLNHILSLGIDSIWRKKTIFLLKKFYNHSYGNILDIASGTGDMSILLANNFANAKIIGLDISEGMLNIAKKKILNHKLKKNINFIQGDVENMPFQDNFFDLITLSFGIRNFDNINLSLQEINRILKSGGYFIILEFSKPDNYLIKILYKLYSKYIIYITKKIVNDSYAYPYLIESIKYFPYGSNLIKKIVLSNFLHIQTNKLTFGIVSVYIIKKK